ncbi:interleukin-1 receptor-associated kinase 4-like isoform X2 [Zerene cesonia]|nr:interleukin-1 receptor-associated kinase 4-like isoform X2 [Zerene cesonia]
MIEEYARESNLKCSEILFDEWATSGIIRPTLSDLKDIIIRTQIYRAADEIALILNEPKPQRPLVGPAAAISTNVTDMLSDSMNNMSSTDSIQMQKFCNGPTVQMKSESNLIKFTENLPKTGIESASDLIKFSKNQILSGDNLQSIQNNDVIEQSMNIPDLSAILTKSQQTLGDTSQSTTNENSNTYNHNLYSGYQKSFPNINISLAIDSAILQDTKLIHFEYEELQNITNNFSDTLSIRPDGPSGRIGSGGFGDVFVGTHPKYGTLAVKKVHEHLTLHRKPDIAIKVFNAEVKFLSQFRHKNILPIFGFSKDGPMPCIVCEYIDGGSLQEKIAEKVLTEIQRINIMEGTAEGLKYLHTSEPHVQSNEELLNLGRPAEFDSENSSKNFVHGDVKSANILLTKDCIPKLCDFGLAKQYDATMVTSCPMGTSAYMAPEGLHGTITQKIDIFSYGIVLLELLTGLKPIVVTNGEKINIKDYVEDNFNGDINLLLDSTVPQWTKAIKLYALAQSCLQRDRKKRPNMNEVCNILYELKK